MKYLIPLISLGLGAALVAHSALAAASLSTSEITEAVKAVIMNRHPEDTPDWWRALGPAAPAVIIEVYEADTSTYHHMRLIEGLSAFGEDPRAVDFIKLQAERSPDQVVRNDVIRMIGITQGAREEEFLSKYLNHEDPHTRLAAALALRKAATASALGKVEAYMAKEQTSWVVAKLKGEAPRSAVPLVPSGSSEDRISSNFAGIWRGYWISPQQEPASGMRSEPVELHLAVQGATELTGELSIKSIPVKDKPRAVTLNGLSGKGAHWSGQLIEQIAGVKPKREETPCEAELVQQAGNYLMQIRLPRQGGLIWLRRD